MLDGGVTGGFKEGPGLVRSFEDVAEGRKRGPGDEDAWKRNGSAGCRRGERSKSEPFVALTICERFSRRT